MGSTQNYAYTTLITKSSYLAGVIVLAYSMQKQGCKYPLVVYYPKSLAESSVKALKNESKRLNLVLRETEMLLPKDNANITLIAERFGDTWTKLRVFDIFELGYEKVCYLDADMIVAKNMDEVFNIELPGQDWLGANHACVCNLDKDAWAPEDWVKENCGYTAVTHPEALKNPTPVKPDSRRTYHLLNSGMFLYHPSKKLWDDMLSYFNTSDKLKTYMFPDQDFLADFFTNKWRSMGWQYNALKTMRYWHENIWRDDEVVCLHYIVDKPWSKRVGEDGVAGYLGRDGITHTWWWELEGEWEAQADKESVEIVSKFMARPIGQEGEESEEMRAIGSGVQAFANNKMK